MRRIFIFIALVLYPILSWAEGGGAESMDRPSMRPLPEFPSTEQKSPDFKLPPVPENTP
jgi:hypothetical protein